MNDRPASGAVAVTIRWHRLPTPCWALECARATLLAAAAVLLLADPAGAADDPPSRSAATVNGSKLAPADLPGAPTSWRIDRPTEPQETR